MRCHVFYGVSNAKIYAAVISTEKYRYRRKKVFIGRTPNLSVVAFIWSVISLMNLTIFVEYDSSAQYFAPLPMSAPQLYC